LNPRCITCEKLGLKADHWADDPIKHPVKEPLSSVQNVIISKPKRSSYDRLKRWRKNHRDEQNKRQREYRSGKKGKLADDTEGTEKRARARY
jgi:hypothetical protein